MMDLMRSWLLSVVCAAMVLALAESVVPEGGVKKVCRLAGGLVILLAAVSPVLKLDEGALAQAMAEYRVTAGDWGEAMEKENILLYQTIIEEKTAAYIVDKAKQLGISCQAEVTFENDENGDPYPDETSVRGTWTDEQYSQLSRFLETDLGIPVQRQRLERIQG